MIELGSKAKDKITGFTGIVIGRTSWLYGCDRYGIKPQSLDKDGKPLEAQWFDEPQLEVLAGPEAVKEATEPKTGGPQNDPSPGREIG